MPTQLQHKAAQTTARVAPKRAIKLADEGIVHAIVSVTGVVDMVNDLIVPGAYAATLRVRTPKVVSDHDWARKVGRTLHAEEWMPGDPRLPKRTKDGKPWPAEAGALVATMQYNLGTVAGREAFEEVKFYAAANEAEFSVGYKVPDGKARKRSDGVRVILAVNLFEFSHVLFGAAPLSMALSVKSAGGGVHSGSAGTTTMPPKLTADKDEPEDFPDDAPPPPVDPEAPWDDTETKRAGVECKTALDVLMEAKSLDLAPEVKTAGNMKGSYEERRTLIESAARDLFDATYADPCVCVVATYDTEAVVTVYSKDESRSFVLPYEVGADGVELGEPSPVELSLVAEPERGTLPAEATDDTFDTETTVEDLTVIAPLMATLTQAQLLAGTEGKVADAVREGVGSFFEAMLGKAFITDEAPADVVEADADTITRETLPEGEWAKYDKTAPIEALRMDAPFTVQTREGVLSCDDGWLAIDSEGYPYPIAADEFDTVYAPAAEAAPAEVEPAEETVTVAPDDLETLEDDVEEKEAEPVPEAPADEAPTDPDAPVTLDPDEHFDTLAELDAPADEVDPNLADDANEAA